jgi:hypothetical protein
MAAGIKMTLFWVVAPCSLVEIGTRFRRACCLHLGYHRPDNGGIDISETSVNLYLAMGPSSSKCR